MKLAIVPLSLTLTEIPQTLPRFALLVDCLRLHLLCGLVLIFLVGIVHSISGGVQQIFRITSILVIRMELLICVLPHCSDAPHLVQKKLHL